MFRRMTLLVSALALVALAHQADSQTPVQKKTDAGGDALPEGALARFGTLRWRHGDVVTFVAFPNAKTVLTGAQDNSIRLWDRDTGKVIRRLDSSANDVIMLKGGGVRVPAYRSANRLTLSHDGKVLANILFYNTIQLINVETGKEIRQLPMPRVGVAAVYFSPDDKSLAVRGTDRTTYLLDAGTGKEICQIKASQPGAIRFAGQLADGSGVAFAPDGKRIATAELEFNMQKVTSYLRLSDTQTGKEINRIDTTPNGASAVAFSPDGKVFAYASGTVIHLKDADTGKEIRKFNILGNAVALMFAPNSKVLAVRGRDQAVRVFDLDAGKSLLEVMPTAMVAQPNVNAGFIAYGVSTEPRDLAFSPDGKILAIGGSQALRFFDVATGKEQAAAAVQGNGGGAGHRAGVTAVVVPRDGKTLVTRGLDNVVRIWNTATGAANAAFSEPAGTNHAAFSPDAKLAALSNVDGSIRIHDVATGKHIHRLNGHANGAIALAFSPDSKRLASRGGSDNTIRVFDVVKGMELRQIAIATPNANPNAGFIVRGSAGGQGLAFSADGLTVAAYVGGTAGGGRVPVGGVPNMNINNALRVWDVATGKELRKFDLPPERAGVTNIAFSPDGRVLAAENNDQTVTLWELASGKARGSLGQPNIAGQPGQPMPIIVGGGGFGRVGTANVPLSPTLAYSPDGTLLAMRGPNNSVRVHEIDTGMIVATFKGHDGTILSLAFAPDGQSLASGSADTTVLLWNVAGVQRSPRPAAVVLKAAEIDALWDDLLGNDAERAGKSIRGLAAAAKQTTPYLSEKVKPASPPDVKKIDQWIKDLDSPVFTKRSKAADELEKLGELAAPALKKVLASSASLELRRRVEPILERVTTGALSAEELRMVRAIETLERIGDADARNVLQALADGAPGALQTRHAQAALERLGRTGKT